MSTRNANEKRFKYWKETQNGGRLYSRRINGQQGWYALYLKETDKDDNTIRFWQEIYDRENNLVEIHEKYPMDRGHKKLKE